MTVELLRGVRSSALGNTRDVFVYLPPGYEPGAGGEPGYPVVVAHDGQHLFEAKGLRPSWRLDRTLDRLIGDGALPPLVVVGVANAGASRGTEYSHVLPYPRDPEASPRGELYERFLIDELLPIVRERYPITSDPARTAVMGSSMGGLVSYHLAFRRPDVFGLAAILSPFLAAVDPVTLDETPVHASYGVRGPRRLWIDIGGMEGLIMVRPVRALVEQLITEVGYEPDRELRYRHDPAAVHHEDAWAERCGSALLHLFGAEGETRLIEGATGRFAVGQVLDPAPLGRRADGCTYTVLDARVEWAPRERLAVRGPRLAVGAQPGPVQLRSALGAQRVSSRLDVVEGGAEVTLEVTIHAPGDGIDPAYFSGLIAERVEPGVFRGRWRLPRGIGLNGTVSRGWRVDGLDASGELIRMPQHVDADQALRIVVDRWTDPDHDDPHHS